MIPARKTKREIEAAFDRLISDHEQYLADWARASDLAAQAKEQTDALLRRIITAPRG